MNTDPIVMVFYVVGSIIGLVILIAFLISFFRMASNVKKIMKSQVDSVGQLFEKALEEAYIGNKPKAKELLLRLRFNIQNRNIHFETVQDKEAFLKKVNEKLTEL